MYTCTSHVHMLHTHTYINMHLPVHTHAQTMLGSATPMHRYQQWIKPWVERLLVASGAGHIHLPDRTQLTRYLDTVVKITDNETKSLFQVCVYIYVQ
jgi:hypothetical protein